MRPVSASRIPFNAEQDDVCTMSARDWRNFIFQLPLLVQADGLLIKDPVYEKVCVCLLRPGGCSSSRHHVHPPWAMLH